MSASTRTFATSRPERPITQHAARTGLAGNLRKPGDPSGATIPKPSPLGGDCDSRVTFAGPKHCPEKRRETYICLIKNPCCKNLPTSRSCPVRAMQPDDFIGVMIVAKTVRGRRNTGGQAIRGPIVRTATKLTYFCHRRNL
jgi:hypothetical protein